jgi:hypothetical protein
MKYNIILKRTSEQLHSGYFSSLDMSGMLFLRSIQSGSEQIYVLGVFYNKPDATQYLEYVKEKGFNDAYIVNQYDIISAAKEAARATPIVSSKTNGNKIYTIQLKAARSPVNMRLFKDYKDVREIYSDDGYYRYVTGEYTQFSKAKEALATIQEAGFADSFIRELNLLIIK